MNDDIRDRFHDCLRRALAATPLGRARRAEMHEELLGHLSVVFDQELERLGDAGAAADSALRRFGDLQQLGGELQASVPLRQRICFTIFHKGKVMWRWILPGVVAVLVGLGFVMPAIAKFTHPDLAVWAESAGLSVALLTLGIALTLAGLGSCVWAAVLKLRPRGG